jgi:hypothetical protein
VTLVSATALDVCTGASVSRQVNAACAILCPPTVSPVLLNPVIAGGQFKFSVATELGRTYSVQYTAAVRPASWQPLTSFGGTGALVTFADPAVNQQRYYRVLVQ